MFKSSPPALRGKANGAPVSGCNGYEKKKKMKVTPLVVLVFAFVMLRGSSRFRQNLHISRIHELFWRPKNHVECLAQSARMHFQSLGRTTFIGFLVNPPILAPVSNRCSLPCHNSSDLVHRRVLHHKREQFNWSAGFPWLSVALTRTSTAVKHGSGEQDDD